VDERPTRKIAVIGSHGIRKTTAVDGLAAEGRARGARVTVVPELIRSNPLGHNESASPEAQLWVVVAQVRAELEAASGADLVVTDRAAVDNFAYYLRTTSGADPYGLEALVRAWSTTTDRFVRLLPDIDLDADGFRSPDPRFRDEIEAILDAWLPRLLPPGRLVTQPASSVSPATDWSDVVAAVLG
jgi:hypothetical protein